MAEDHLTNEVWWLIHVYLILEWNDWIHSETGWVLHARESLVN